MTQPSLPNEELLLQLEALQQRFDALKQSFDIELDKRQSIEFALQERLKELSCHNQISELMANPMLSLTEVIEQIVQIIPPSWQFPEIAQAIVVVNEKTYQTPNYIKSRLSLRQNINVNSKIIGHVEVSYPEDQIKETTKIFLPEETDLLFSIAVKIGSFIERSEKDTAIYLNEEKYRTLVETINEIIYEFTLDGIIKYMSPAVERILGYKAEELVGKSVFDILYAEDRPILAERLALLVVKPASLHEYRFLTKTGKICWMSKSTVNINKQDQQITSRVGILRDVTEQKKSEEALLRANRLYSVISHINQAIVHFKDKSKLFEELCSVAVDYGEFRMAWIGIVDNNSERVIPFVSKGYDADYLSLIKPISLADCPEGNGPTGTALRNGKYFVCNNIESDPHMKPWKNEALKRGYRSSIALPIKQFWKVVASFNLYSSIPYFFNEEETKLLENIVGDIGFAFESIELDNERKKAEEETKKFRTIMDEANYGSALTAMDGTILYINQAFAQMHQYEVEEVIGKHISMLHSKQQLSQVELSLKILAANGEFSALEIWHMRKDGSVFPTLMNASVIFDENHQPQYQSATAIDISDLIQKEDELRQSEERLNYAQELGNMGSWEHNLVTNQMTCSNNYYKQLGLRPGEHKDDLYHYFVSIVHPDDFKIVEYLQTTDYAINKTEIVELRIILPDGTIRWLQNNVVPVFENEKLIGLKGVNIDITDRKLTEEEIRKFRTITDQANYGSAISTLDGIITYVNHEFARMHQREPEEVIGKHLSIFHNPEQLARVEETIELLRLHGKYSAEEVWRTRKDGSVFPSLMNASIIVDSNKIPQYLSATAIDITDLKQKEAELLRNEQDLNYAQEIAKMGSWELDLRTNKLNLSKNYYSILGLELTDHDNLQKILTQRIHPDDIKLQQQILDEMKQTLKPSSIDYRITMPDGKTKWIQNNIVPVIEGNELVGIKGVNIDISDKKIAAEEIRNQNLKLNAIINAIPDLMFILDSSGTYLEFYSKHVEKLIAPVDGFIGKNLSDFFEKKAADYYIKNIHDCIDTRNLTSFEYTIDSTKGLNFFEARLSPLDENKVLAFIRDITDKKQTEVQIKKLSQAVEQSPVLVVVTGLDGNIEYVNPEFTKVTGYSYEESIGQNPRILQSGKTDSSVYKNLWDTIKQGNQWQGEWINKKKNGELFWEAVVITPIQNEQNVTTNYLAVKQDITQRKLAEEEIRDLNASLEKKIEERTAQLAEINHSLKKEIEERKIISEALQVKTNELENFFSVALDLLCIADTQGNFIRVNKAWENILGYSASDLEKRKFLEFVHPDDIQATLDTIAELSEQHPILNFTNRYLTKDGTYRFIEWRSTPSGQLIYAAARDITERIKAEEETQNARKEAEQANLAKSEFLSRMSHELRTPMNAILGFAQLLEMGQLNPSQRKGVDHILRGGKHLLDLINEVLDISRIESGRLSLSVEPVRLNEVLEEMIDNISPLAEKRQVKISLINSPDNFSFVKTDRQRLKQVLLNLISNAIKYNRDQGNVNIITKIIYNQDKPVVTRISVTDTGLGIHEDDLPKLFKPFERIGLEQTTTEGSGLGLAVVKKLVEAMNGNVGVESKYDEGSTFWIELPHTEDQTKSINGIEIFGEDSANTTDKTGTILYIEDNNSNIELIEQILNYQRPNIRLISHTNGKQTVSLCTDHKPDLILLDLNLPDIHGSEVLALLQSQKETKDIPVVIISADAMPQQLNKLLKAGARNYLTKPLDIPEFLKVIDNFLPAVT